MVKHRRERCNPQSYAPNAMLRPSFLHRLGIVGSLGKRYGKAWQKRGIAIGVCSCYGYGYGYLYNRAGEMISDTLIEEL